MNPLPLPAKASMHLKWILITKIFSSLKYIHENPVWAGWVQYTEDYLYCSAQNYTDLDTLI